MKPIVFLDFDGVLNSVGSVYAFGSPSKIERLNQECRDLEAQRPQQAEEIIGLRRAIGPRNN